MKASLVHDLQARADDAPFGITWLKGLTLRRFGVVLLIVLLYCASSITELVQISFGDWPFRTSRRFLATGAAKLDPQTFWQIHRSTVVNVDAFAGVHRDSAAGFA
jgi:hypothetical protein